MGPRSLAQRLSPARHLGIRELRTLGLDSEVGFWHALMDPETRNNPDVDPAAWQSARTWLEEGATASAFG